MIRPVSILLALLPVAFVPVAAKINFSAIACELIIYPVTFSYATDVNISINDQPSKALVYVIVRRMTIVRYDLHLSCVIPSIRPILSVDLMLLIKCNIDV